MSQDWSRETKVAMDFLEKTIGDKTAHKTAENRNKFFFTRTSLQTTNCVSKRKYKRQKDSPAHSVFFLLRLSFFLDKVSL